MPRKSLMAITAVILVSVAVPTVAHAIVFGQVDTFQTGSTAGWTSNRPPTIVGGGPGGAGDKYLQTTSPGGSGSDGILGLSNTTQWKGDYLSSGVTAVSMDLCNLGAVDLQMRVYLYSQAGGGFTSTIAYPLPADGSWHHAVFGLTASDLTWLGGSTGVLETTLQHNSILNIQHLSGPPDGAYTPVAGRLGIDNIRAIPEPGAMSLLALGFVASAFRRGRTDGRRN
jgi:hypothetical protein